MKLDATMSADGQHRVYCMACRRKGPVPIRRQGLTYYACEACGAVLPRRLEIDPDIKWWADEGGEYWHESAGVFVRAPGDKWLFFRRTKYPFGLTVPAGHLGFGEAPETGARRELAEETSLEVPSLAAVGVDNIVGDQCRRGADAHRWHCFGVRLEDRSAVAVASDEGTDPSWLTLDEALATALTPTTRRVLRSYRRQLERL